MGAMPTGSRVRPLLFIADTRDSKSYAAASVDV